MAEKIMRTDVVIAGGGMVGMTLGLALAQGGLDVAIADPLTPARMADETFDGRVSALAFASVRMFRALSLWDALEAHAQPINDIVVSDGSPRPSRLAVLVAFRFTRDRRADGPHRREPSYSSGALRSSGTRKARQAHGRLFGARSFGVTDETALLDFEDGTAIEATLAVAAEGRDSHLREAQGIKSIGWDYPQVGIVTTVEHERPHEGVAHEHFLPSGPFAILPMTKKRSSLVWTEKARSRPP